MQHISALNLSSFRWKFLHRNSERYVWNRALDVPNCRRSFRFTHIYIFSIYFEWISVFRFSLYRNPFKIAIKYLKNNLSRPFENCEFTPLLHKYVFERWLLQAPCEFSSTVKIYVNPQVLEHRTLPTTFPFSIQSCRSCYATQHLSTLILQDFCTI